MGTCYKMLKKKKATQNGSIQVIQRDPSLRKPRDPKWIRKDVISPVFKSEIFCLAAKLMALAHNPSGVVARA